ncbi:hypothetical protein [uncultured Roseovarius sp.]|uniref:hypothetical protein n=1 Tax=uncultured Roseovarius sp. TaxID=293344 RepID=UPI0026115713|nr:hypothetical protein [uncultured Roseovarius sp.]
MSVKTLTLLAILTFVAVTVGSFVWFIVTWDKAKEEPVTLIAPAYTIEERIT